MSLPRVPIPDHPGFWRQGKLVVFKYRDDRRRLRWGRGPTIAAAKRRKAELETDVRRGEYQAASRDQVTTYARGWIATYAGRTTRGIRAHTRGSYQRVIETDVATYFGGLTMGEVRPQDVKAFAAWLAGGREGKSAPMKPSSVRRKLAPVKAMFATAFEEGVIRRDPAAGVRIASPVKLAADGTDVERIKALSPSELDAVLEQIAAGSWWDGWLRLFEFLADTGLRYGEAAELRWSDVDLGSRQLKVRRAFRRADNGVEAVVDLPKSSFARRTITLTPAMATALWELRKETRAADSDLVFVGPRGGRLNYNSVLTKVLKPAAVNSGLGEWIERPKRRRRADSWVGFHTFRHTCATSLFRAGWNAVQVQLWLGHHSPSFTLARYVHLLPEDIPEAISIAGGTRRGTQSTYNHPKTVEPVEPLKMALQGRFPG